MLLLVDAGNTDIKICIYDDGVKELVRLSRVSGMPLALKEVSRVLNDLISHHKEGNLEGAVISSVVIDVTDILAEAVRDATGKEPLLVSSRADTGLELLVKNPEETGADRLANAAAANRLYPGSKVVVDFGTATTLSVVTEDGGFRGGVIMPGPDISASALAEKTSKLPAVELKPPYSALADNTTDAILSGIIIGHAGAVEKVLKSIVNETGMDYTVVITGGRSGIISDFLDFEYSLDPDLTFKGLDIIYRLNT